MSWTFLLKVWPLFRCSCMAVFGCSLRFAQPAIAGTLSSYLRTMKLRSAIARTVWHTSGRWATNCAFCDLANRPQYIGLFDDGSSICLKTRIPVRCISTETAHPKISPCSSSTPNSCCLPRILPQSRPQRRMIGAYGDTSQGARRDSQTRQPQLGPLSSARPGSRYGIRTEGTTPAAHARDVYLVD